MRALFPPLAAGVGVAVAGRRWAAGLLLARPMVLLFYGAGLRAGKSRRCKVLARRLPLRLLHVDPARRGDLRAHLDRRLVATTAIGLTTNIVLNVLFIPRLGHHRGPPWATGHRRSNHRDGLLFVQVQRPAGVRRIAGVSMTARQARASPRCSASRCFLSYAYFYGAGGLEPELALRADSAPSSNANTLQIDAYQLHTGRDRAPLAAAHYYTDKGAGPIAAGVGPRSRWRDWRRAPRPASIPASFSRHRLDRRTSPRW